MYAKMIESSLSARITKLVRSMSDHAQDSMLFHCHYGQRAEYLDHRINF